MDGAFYTFSVINVTREKKKGWEFWILVGLIIMVWEIWYRYVGNR